MDRIIKSSQGRCTYIVPDCCDGPRDFRQRLALGVYAVNKDPEDKPEWKITIYGSAGHELTNVEFCPFCGKKLPDFVKRENPPEKVCKTDGYYCDTCGERLMNCHCDPTWITWRPIYKGC